MTRVRDHSPLCDQIHRYIADNGRAKVPTISNFFEITEKAARRQLERLKVQKRIIATGPQRSPEGFLVKRDYESIKTPPVPTPQVVAKMEKTKVRRMVKPPVTQYHTQWVGNVHPCEQFNPWALESA